MRACCQAVLRRDVGGFAIRYQQQGPVDDLDSEGLYCTKIVGKLFWLYGHLTVSCEALSFDGRAVSYHMRFQKTVLPLTLVWRESTESFFFVSPRIVSGEMSTVPLGWFICENISNESSLIFCLTKKQHPQQLSADVVSCNVSNGILNVSDYVGNIGKTTCLR